MDNNPYAVKQATPGTVAQQPPPQVHATTLQHPPLPSTATTIERIALPMAFSIVNTCIRDPQEADKLRSFMVPLRDALNDAYPED